MAWAKGKTVVKRAKVAVQEAPGSLGATATDEDGEQISVWNPDEVKVIDSLSGQVKEVELFYSGGDICDITKKPREVVVRLKCKTGQTSLSLYLLEPKTCSYILGLESELLCSILSNVDSNGLIITE